MSTRGERYKRKRKATAELRRVSREVLEEFKHDAQAVIRCRVLVDATAVFHHERLPEDNCATSAPLAIASRSRAGRAVVGLSSPADALSNRERSLGQSPIGTLDDRLQLVRDANKKKAEQTLSLAASNP